MFLFCIQCETTESRYRQLFILSFEVLFDRLFRIFYKFLLQQSKFFVVFLQRTLCDAVDEIFGFAGFTGFFTGDFEFFLDNIGRNFFGTDGNGIHGSNLHSHIAGYLVFYIGFFD